MAGRMVPVYIRQGTLIYSDYQSVRNNFLCKINKENGNAI